MISYSQIFTGPGAAITAALTVACMFAASEIDTSRWEKTKQLEKECVSHFSRQIPRVLKTHPEYTPDSLRNEIESQICNEYELTNSDYTTLKAPQKAMIDHEKSMDASLPFEWVACIAGLYFVLWLIPVLWRFLLARIAELRAAIIGR